jgi:hypothetical protein
LRRAVFLAAAAGALHLRAQELRAQQSPLTAWLDLRPAAPGAPPQTTPAWIEAFDFIPAEPGASRPTTMAVNPSVENNLGQGVDRTRSVYRIRLQQPAAAVNDLQVRVFFDDLEGVDQPFVSVWNELGTELMRSGPLGQGLGLPSSETLTVPMSGVDYLEISAPGDGAQVRSVFLSWLEKGHVLQPADFPARDSVRQPFHILSSTRRDGPDSYLYGVVTASLQGPDAVVLRGPNATASFDFELEHQPLVAVVTYEVLGVTLGEAPTIRLNHHEQGSSDVHLPDLSDPGFRGEQREASTQMNFRYTGWVHAQKVIPGEMLNAGLNSLAVTLSEGSDTVAIRSLEIQLKYNWEKLDYILAPATP